MSTIDLAELAEYEIRPILERFRELVQVFTDHESRFGPLPATTEALTRYTRLANTLETELRRRAHIYSKITS